VVAGGGIRVARAHRARHRPDCCIDTHIALATAHGPGTIRLLTGGDNHTMHHIAGGSGFRKIGQYAHLLAPALTRAEATRARAGGALLALRHLPPGRSCLRFARSCAARCACAPASGVVATGWSVVEVTPAPWPSRADAHAPGVRLARDRRRGGALA
jgi:hypothetical protein